MPRPPPKLMLFALTLPDVCSPESTILAPESWCWPGPAMVTVSIVVDDPRPMHTVPGYLAV